MTMSHRSFALVLAGGGARGYAHVGVLSALAEEGLAPAGIVGVSMGAVVATTYALRDDWLEALLEIDTSGFPHPPHGGGEDEVPLVRRAVEYVHAAWSMVRGWGAPSSAVEAGRAVLADLLGGADLRAGRVPVAVCATDLRTGARVTIRQGPAHEAVYASAALAGVLPPLRHGEYLLADGAYADIAPIDVAADMGADVVIAVDPGQEEAVDRIGNGLHCVMRAMEICHRRHAELRMREADLVLRPRFGRGIDVLDFDARLECVAAGRNAVMATRGELRALLRPE